MAYRFRIECPDTARSKTLVRGTYVTLHVNAPGFGKDVHRSIIQCQTSRFANMRPSQVPADERLDFVIDLELLLYSNVIGPFLQGQTLPVLYSGFQLADPSTKSEVLKNIISWRKWWTDKAMGTQADRLAAPPIDNVQLLAVTELSIGLHIYTPVRLVEGDDEAVLDRRALRDNACKSDEYETQIAEVNVPLWLLLDMGQLAEFKQEETSLYHLAVMGNDSGAWSFLKDGSDARLGIACRGRVDSVPCLSNSKPLAWSAVSNRIRAYVSATLVPAAKKWKSVLATDFNNGYASAFARDLTGLDAYKSKSGVQHYWTKIRRSYLPRHKIPPYIPQLYLLHAMILELYTKPEFLGNAHAVTPVGWVRSAQIKRDPTELYGDSDRESITVPIWYYSISRRPRITADRSILRGHLAVILCAYNNALKIYGFDAENDANGAATYRAKLKTLWSKQAYLYVETDRSDLVAANDLIALFLTSFGWMGKYHSDIALQTDNDDEKPRARVRATESCDFTRLAGTSASDDCEGCESCVRDAYTLCTSLFARRDMIPDVAQLWPNSSTMVETAQLLSTMMTYVHTHYDYYAVSGETASAYPGLHTAMPRSMEATSDAETIQRMKTGLSGLRYASEADSTSEPGFHQYGLLMPVILQHQMTAKTFDSPMGYTSDVSSSLSETIVKYTQSRASVSDPQSPRRSRDKRTSQNSLDDAFIPPAVILEGTCPTSTLFIGPSVFSFYNLQKRPYPSNVQLMTAYQRAVIAADVGSSIATIRAKYEVSPLIKHIPSQFAIHPPYKRTPGVLSADMTRLITIDDEPRFTSAWYRRVCHGVNVTMLETLGMDTQRNAACAYVTFVNGQCNGFGVPLEDLQLLSLPSGHPDCLTYPLHELAYPFARLSDSVFTELDTLESTLRVLDRLPPVNVHADFSPAADTGKLYQIPGISADISDLARCAHHSIAERILKTRLYVMDTDEVDSAVLLSIRNKMTIMPPLAGSPVNYSTLRTWRENLYPTFTRSRVFVSVIEA